MLKTQELFFLGRFIDVNVVDGRLANISGYVVIIIIITIGKERQFSDS
jgi:hypothetical protein